LTFDVIVTDPPYGTGYYATDCAVDPIALLAQYDKPMAVMGWPELLVSWCVAAGLTPQEWITWWPTNGGARGFNPKGLWRESEGVAAFGDWHWKQLRQPRTSTSRSVLDGQYGADGNRRLSHLGESDWRYMGDVWTCAAPGLAFNSHQRQHPNEKPLEMLRLLVQAAPPGVVCDPFMGSGTTLRAAKDAGRISIGVELDEGHCETAVKRLAQEVLPL
jgi:DNA modification methylase